MTFLTISLSILLAVYAGYKFLFPDYPWHQMMVVEIGDTLQLIAAIGLLFLYRISKNVSKRSADQIPGGSHNG